VALADRAQLNFRLKPECPAVHMADDGLAIGVRWPDTFFNRIATQLQLMREQSPLRQRGPK
jgi:hypothetical protein